MVVVAMNVFAEHVPARTRRIATGATKMRVVRFTE